MSERWRRGHGGGGGGGSGRTDEQRRAAERSAHEWRVTGDRSAEPTNRRGLRGHRACAPLLPPSGSRHP